MQHKGYDGRQTQASYQKYDQMLNTIVQTNAGYFDHCAYFSAPLEIEKSHVHVSSLNLHCDPRLESHSNTTNEGWNIEFRSHGSENTMIRQNRIKAHSSSFLLKPRGSTSVPWPPAKHTHIAANVKTNEILLSKNCDGTSLQLCKSLSDKSVLQTTENSVLVGTRNLTCFQN